MAPWKIASAILVFVLLSLVFAENAIPVGNHKYLPETLSGAERIPIDIAEDYKPCLIRARK